MCGIAGIYDQAGAPTPRPVIEKMTRLLTHRGPDDEGFLIAPHIALGHRRLSIIDLSSAGQNPIFNEDRSLAIVFNGEIYNYRELKKNLANRRPFKTATDTEVILRLYEEEGPASISKLNGMFAIAIWDAKKKSLFLARDRFGVKPLYYTRVGNQFAFASEAKAFLALPGFSVKADPRALSEHFTFQNMFGERTLFRGVNLLEAGHTLTCDADGVRLKRFWDLEFNPKDGITEKKWAAGLRERFEAAVERQLVSDVPVGSYLSGGMDTGSISAVAVRKISGMHTFTCGFKLPEGGSELEKHFDESAESREMAALLGTKHHELTLDHTALIPVLPRIVWHMDEPRVGISYQVYHMAEMIKKHVTVVLSGVGGDELFAGYPWRYGIIQAIAPGDFDDAYYASWVRLLGEKGKSELFAPALLKSLGGFSPRQSFDDVLKGANGADPLHKALYFDFKTFLNGLLITDDKLSMAHSVEARVPFLDNEFVDYVATIPSNLKLKDGAGKYILKEAMRGLLPDETLFRRKQGFTPPDETWYRQHHMKYIRDTLLSTQAVGRGYFNPGALEKILSDHESGKNNHRFLIWSLISFEWWNRLFVDGEYKNL